LGDGLGQEIVRPGLQPSGDILVVLGRGQQHEIAVVAPFTGPESPAQIQPGFHSRPAGKGPVGQDDVGFVPLAQLQRVGDRPRLHHLVMGALQLDREDAPLRGIGADNQDAPRQPVRGRLGKNRGLAIRAFHAKVITPWR
jgi:hypothetical protein